MYNEEFAIVKSAVLEVGELLKKYFGSDISFDLKRDQSLVSKADKEAEELLKERLLEAYPKSHFLGEETGERLGLEGYKRQWAVDPLDGTTNFLHRIPYFCTSVAMSYEGKWVLGIIYNPISEDFFYAIDGQGAYCNGKKMQSSHLSSWQEAVVVWGRAFSSIYDEKVCGEIYNILSDIRATRSMGSAALDLAYVADGRFDLHFCKGLHVWDTAAAFVMLKETGAEVKNFKGEAYVPEDANIVAGSADLVKELGTYLSEI